MNDNIFAAAPSPDIDCLKNSEAIPSCEKGVGPW